MNKNTITFGELEGMCLTLRSAGMPTNFTYISGGSQSEILLRVQKSLKGFTGDQKRTLTLIAKSLRIYKTSIHTKVTIEFPHNQCYHVWYIGDQFKIKKEDYK